MWSTAEASPPGGSYASARPSYATRRIPAYHFASTAAERGRIEHHAELYTVRDVLAVMSQRLTAPLMSSSTVGASCPAPEDAEAAPAEKRPRHPSSDRTGSPFFE